MVDIFFKIKTSWPLWSLSLIYCINEGINPRRGRKNNEGEPKDGLPVGWC